MRVRIPELLRDRQISAYQLSKRSAGRISMSAAYRLARKEGHFGFISAAILEALCDTLGVGPGELLERSGGKRKK